jgi:hypothetical protein
MWTAIKAFMVAGSYERFAVDDFGSVAKKWERTLTERWTRTPLRVPEGEHLDAATPQPVVEEVVQAREVEAANPSQGSVLGWNTAPGLGRYDRERRRQIV